MDEGEFIALHRSVVLGFVDQAIQKMNEFRLLIGCDTSGFMEIQPERLLTLGCDVQQSSHCPDFLLTHQQLALSMVSINTHCQMKAYGGLSLIRQGGI